MKKIIVCGCSWMSCDYGPEIKGTHFSERLADELGYELIMYSRPGSSNGGICVQIEEAIKAKPDLILFGQTVADRVEVRIIEEMFTGKGFIYYDDPVALADLVGKHEDNPSILSDNLSSLLIGSLAHVLKDKSKSWCDERTTALQNWFNLLYSPKMKRQIDTWCLYAVQHKLYESKIPAIKVIDLLNYDTPWYKCCTGDTYKPTHYIPDVDSVGYHTNTSRQKDIVNDIKNYISKNNLL